MFDYKTKKYRKTVSQKVITKTWQRKAVAIRALVEDHNADVLELGCGEIPFIEGSTRVDVADINQSNHIQHDLNLAIPLHKQYDYIITSELVGHLHNVDMFLSECARLLGPSGMFIISARNAGWWRTRLQLLVGNDSWFTDGYYKQYFTPGSLKRKLRKHGFIVDFEYNKNPRLPLSLSHGFMLVCRKNRWVKRLRHSPCECHKNRREEI